MSKNALTVTLIIPVYNAERFAAPFLESLSKQARFPEQVLFVNDGSTDNSREILCQFAQMHPEVRIIDQVNQGAGKARNRALSEALGDIVGFADIDDILDPNLIGRVIEAFEKQNELEVVVLNGQPFWEDARETSPLIVETHLNGLVDGQRWINERLRYKNFEHYAWLYYVKNEFVKNNRLRFGEGIGHEDVQWVTELVLCTRKLIFINECLYRYRQRQAFLEEVPLRNRVADLESAIVNTLAIGRLLHTATLTPETFGCLRQEFVNGGCSKSHELRCISDKVMRQKLAKNMLQSGLLRQLWRDSKGFKEQFRVIKAWFRVKLATR